MEVRWTISKPKVIAVKGEVVGATRSILGHTYLVVACTDGKIREVEIDKANLV